VGIATSFFMLGISYKNKRWIQLILFVIAISFHKSVLLAVLPYFLTLFYKNSRGYIVIWISSIVLSLLFGGFWESLFAGFNLGDERLSEYLTTKADSTLFSSTGFRWDFLIFSAVPVILSSYYIYKKHYTDEFYVQLFNIYLIANSFWILIIRANYSNRFASISWVIMPLLLILPLLNVRIWSNQKNKLGIILLLSFAFTYSMSFKLIWG